MLSVAAFAADIVPAPREYKKRDGVFTILTTTKITHYPELRPSANYLAEYLPLSVHEHNGESAGNIVLKTNKNLAAEAYTLDISAEGVVIEAIDNLAAQGQVKVRGAVWTARTAADGAVIPVGAHVQVLRIEGVRAIVALVPAPVQEP